jgi:hypothetical protein
LNFNRDFTDNPSTWCFLVCFSYNVFSVFEICYLQQVEVVIDGWVHKQTNNETSGWWQQ